MDGGGEECLEDAGRAVLALDVEVVDGHRAREPGNRVPVQLRSISHRPY